MALPQIDFDITTLTLGEAAEAERASGQSIQELMQGTFSRLLLAMYVNELRSSGDRQSWSELSNLRLLDASSLISPAPVDTASETSSGSPSETPST